MERKLVGNSAVERRNSTFRAWVAGSVFLSSIRVFGQTPEFSLWVVEVNGLPCPSCPTRDLPELEVQPGDIIRVDAFVGAWDDDLAQGVCSGDPSEGFGEPCPLSGPGGCSGKHCIPGGQVCVDSRDCPEGASCSSSVCTSGPLVGAFQWSLDEASLTSGTLGTLQPARIACESTDCEFLSNGDCPCAQYFRYPAQCTCVAESQCESDGFCSLAASSFIEAGRTDFLLFNEQNQLVVRRAGTELVWGGVAMFDGVTGGATPRYIGSVLLQASEGSFGTFELRMREEPNRTFLLDPDGHQFDSSTFLPVTIRLPELCPGVHCDDGNPCTRDHPDPGRCVCFFDLIECPPGKSCVDGTCVDCCDGVECHDGDCCTADRCSCIEGVPTCQSEPVVCSGFNVRCNPQRCRCEGPACRRVVSSEPPHCVIDARQPHEINHPTPVQGLDHITLIMDPGCDASLLVPSSFGVQYVPIASGEPSVQSVTAVENVATVFLDRPIPPGRWTCLVLLTSGSRVCMGSLPGDVDGSRLTNVFDLIALIDSLNHPLTAGRPDWAIDIRRSGLAGAEDIARMIDLLNGAGAYDPWIAASLPPCPPQR